MKIRKTGIFLVFMAIFIIVSGLGYLGDIGVWTVIFSGALLAWFISGLVKLSWGNMFFPLAFAAILYDEMLGIEQLTPFPVLAAALLGTIGLNMIFPKKKKIKVNKSDSDVVINIENGNWSTNKTVEECFEDDNSFKCEVSFGSAVKYINCQQLKRANIENSFGNLQIYFDNAKLDGGKAVAYVKSSFGKTTLYIPKEWTVHNNISKAFGSISENGTPAKTSDSLLVIEGEAAFGNLEINYI